MGLLGFEVRAPEVATVVRWLLRFVLVGFLAWLVKGRQDQDQEEEEPEEDQDEAWQRQRQAYQQRGQQRAPRNNNYNNNYNTRLQGKDPYAPRDVRQRRPATGESVDFDAVINKLSKPKTMWEVRKSGEAPQIIKRDSFSEVDSSPKAAVREKLDLKKKTPEPEAEASVLKKTMLHGHARPVTWITWNRDGNLLFTCGKDKRVSVWSFPDGECLGSYEGHNGAVWACSVTVDSRWLVTGGADQNVIVWEAGTSRELARVELPGVCRFVEWASSGSSSDERFTSVHNKFGSNPPAVTVFGFDGETITQQLRIDSLPGPATQVRWGRDDSVLVTSHESGEIIFWRADTGAEVRRLKAHESPISKIDFSADRRIVATASTDKKLKVWDLGEEGSDGKLLYEMETDRPLNAIALGAITRGMATGTEERPGCCTVIAAGGQDVRDVAMSNSTSDQFDTLLFKIGESKLEADGSLKGHFGPVHTLAFKADGSAMASGSEDGCVRLHVFSDPTASK